MLHLLLFLLFAASALAQFSPRSFDIAGARGLDDATPEPRLVSNVIIDILPESVDTLWLGTGNGVSRVLVDALEPWRSQFETYTQEDGLGKGGVSGLYVSDSILWSAFAFDTSVGVSGAGGGLAYSRDQGRNWIWFPQPRDRRYGIDPQSGRDTVLGYWPTTTNVDNITYDIALSDSNVWIVSKGGGLRKHAYDMDYTDFDDTTGWIVVSPDSFPFHPGSEERLNHRTFSVLFAENALWVGTAGGINKSTDEGQTWQQFNANNNGISGNFVTAMAYQEATSTVWAATWRASGQNEFYAVSKTTDGGVTWTAHLTEDQIEQAIGRSETPRVHGFAFDTTVVYACDDIGLWKSTDGGANWGLFPIIEDQTTGRKLWEAPIYAARKHEGLLWAGGINGLAVSGDEGAHWQIFQTGAPLDEPARAVETYASPTPWSPARHRPVWLWYNTNGGAIKVTIYDFAMSEVVEQPAITRGPGFQYEPWDGRKNGTIVANGTYFYKIERPEGEVWGKLIVLD